MPITCVAAGLDLVQRHGGLVRPNIVDEAAIPAALKNAAGRLLAPRDATFLKTRGGACSAWRPRATDARSTSTRPSVGSSPRRGASSRDGPRRPRSSWPPRRSPRTSRGGGRGQRTARRASAPGRPTTRQGRATGTRPTSSCPRGASTARSCDPVRRSSSGVPSARSASGPATASAASVGGPCRTEALAGGICAVSTTLFNAAAGPAQEILSRRPHYYYINRYPLGLDATVSDAITMRFRNDAKNPILSTASASGSFVRFDLWSIPNGRTVTWTRSRASRTSSPAATASRYTSSLPKGVRERDRVPGRRHGRGRDPGSSQRRWLGHPSRHVRVPLQADDRGGPRRSR